MKLKWNLQIEIIQAAIAIAALTGGFLLYQTTRISDQVLLFQYLPQLTSNSNIYADGIIYSIPSFLHVYAFILLTAVLFEDKHKAIIYSCLFWLLVELFFELGQHPLFAQNIAHTFSEFFNHSEWSLLVGNYFLNGRFDSVDIIFKNFCSYTDIEEVI